MFLPALKTADGSEQLTRWPVFYVWMFTETTPLAPNSPYAASKASSDLLCRAFFHTFDFPVLITRCSNNYGPYQFPRS